MIFRKKYLILVSGFVSVACLSTRSKHADNIDMARYIPAGSISYSYTPEPLTSDNQVINSSVERLFRSFLGLHAFEDATGAVEFQYIREQLSAGKGLTFGAYENRGASVSRVNFGRSEAFSSWLVGEVKQNLGQAKVYPLGKGTVVHLASPSKRSHRYLYVSSGSVAVSRSVERMEPARLKQVFGVSLPGENVAAKVEKVMARNAWKPSYISYSAGGERYEDYLLNFMKEEDFIEALQDSELDLEALGLDSKSMTLCVQDAAKLMSQTGDVWMGARVFRIADNAIDIQLESTLGHFKNKNLAKFMELFSGKAPVVVSSGDVFAYSLSVNGEKFGASMQGLAGLIAQDLSCPPLKQYADKLSMGFLIQGFVKPLKGVSFAVQESLPHAAPTLTLGMPLGEGKGNLISVLNSVGKAKGMTIPREGQLVQVNKGENKKFLTHSKEGLVFSSQRIRSPRFTYKKSAFSVELEPKKALPYFFEADAEQGSEANSGSLYGALTEIEGLAVGFDLYLVDKGGYKTTLHIKSR